jgi:biopolymer transport protein ExbD
MNPLIDVSLVLLIFFIITATYEELRKKFPAPGSSTQSPQTRSESAIRDVTIKVVIQSENGQDAYLVEDERVPEENLQAKLEEWVKKTGRAKLAIEVDKRCSWRSFMKVQDAAAGANIQEIVRLERGRGGAGPSE